jgi:hypothetical protein
MEQKTEVHVQITLQDFIRTHALSARKRGLPAMIMMAVFWVFLIVWIILDIISHPGASLSSILYSWSSTALIVFCLPFAGIILVQLVARRAYKNDTLIGKPRTYSFDTAGMSCVNENSNTRVLWSDVKRFLESKHVFLIVLSSRNVFVIPKRGMTEERADQLRLLFRTSIPAQKGWRGYWAGRLIFYGLLVGLTWMYVTYEDPGIERAKVYFDKGCKFEKIKEYTRAEAEFTKAIQENPKMAAAYNFRGYCRKQLGDKTGNLEDCSKAVVLDSTYANAYLALASARADLGNNSGACEAAQKAKKLGDTAAIHFIEYYCK